MEISFDFSKICPESTRATLSRRTPGICRICSNMAKTQMDTICLDCARERCVRNKSDSWRTGVFQGFAIAMKSDTAEECESCYGTGSITFSEKHNSIQYSFVEDCPGLSLDQKLQSFNSALCPGTNHGATFAKYEVVSPTAEGAKEACEEYARKAKEGSKGVFLVGKNGTGKTHLLVAIAKTLTIAKGKTVRYIDQGDLVRIFKEGIQTNTSERDIAKLEKIPFLLIDELGKGQKKEWREELVEGLLERRYRDPNLSTCFASNYSGEELKSRIGERLASRLAEMASVSLIVASDFRQRGGG